MNNSERFYQETQKAYTAKRYVDTLEWAKRTIFVICKSIYEEKSPDPKRQRLSEYLKDMEAHKYVDYKIIHLFRTIQVFRNSDSHNAELDIDKISETDITPVVSALDHIMVWYRKEYSHHLEGSTKIENGWQNDKTNKDLYDEKTIFIVIPGKSHELPLDKKAAQVLTYVIWKTFDLSCAIVSDDFFNSNKSFEYNRIISLGSPERNTITKEIKSKSISFPFMQENYIAKHENTIALWSVSYFITLISFLKIIKKKNLLATLLGIYE